MRCPETDTIKRDRFSSSSKPKAKTYPYLLIRFDAEHLAAEVKRTTKEYMIIHIHIELKLNELASLAMDKSHIPLILKS